MGSLKASAGLALGTAIMLAGTGTRACLLALGSSIAGLGLPGAAWAHHPGAGSGGSWASLAFLVVGLAFAVIWVVLASLEKPPSRRSSRQHSDRK